MADEVRKALENHKKGYNCAQAVACAFSEQLGMDEKEVFRLMEPLGLEWEQWEPAELCQQWRLSWE